MSSRLAKAPHLCPPHCIWKLGGAAGQEVRAALLLAPTLQPASCLVAAECLLPVAAECTGVSLSAHLQTNLRHIETPFRKSSKSYSHPQLPYRHNSIFSEQLLGMSRLADFELSMPLRIYSLASKRMGECFCRASDSYSQSVLPAYTTSSSSFECSLCNYKNHWEIGGFHSACNE